MLNIKSILIGIAVIGGLFALRFIAKNFGRIRKFFVEVWVELVKVAWPTRKELIGSTWIVLVTAFLLSIFIGSVDFMFSQILTLIIK